MAKSKKSKYKLVPRITGTGWSVPGIIRKNDAPIFDYLNNLINSSPPIKAMNLFEGYKERRVLDDHQSLISNMLPATQMALLDADKTPEEIDLLLGTGSVSHKCNPNELCEVTANLQYLGLGPNVWTIPIANDFTNFNASLLIADSLIRTGRVKRPLICIGANWTRNVFYNTFQSLSAGDGAGAAVMEMSDDPTKWYVVDTCTLTDTSFFGGMYTAGNPIPVSPPVNVYSPPATGYDIGWVDHLYTYPFYQINELGVSGFKAFGEQLATKPVLELMKRNKLRGEDIAIIPQQSSGELLDAWKPIIKWGQLVITMERFGNTTSGEHIITLAFHEDPANQVPIYKNNLILFGLGPEMHANAILLRREVSPKMNEAPLKKPVKKAKSAQPAKPAKKTAPAKSVKPAKPVKKAKPAKPAKPAKKAKAAKTGKAAGPVKKVKSKKSKK